MARISVLGTGRVGGEVAYLAAVLGIADELVMYDAASAFLQAQVLDLRHTGIDVPVSTDWREVAHTDICIFSAGIPRNPSIKTRADLLHANLPVASECGQAIRRFGGVLITVTNPMDANNYYLCRKNGLEPRRCIGFGGQLDSVRFGLELKEHTIRGRPFVIGDHGENQVPLFSHLEDPVDIPLREEILDRLRGASMEIIKGKGGTVFGPAYHIVNLVRAILSDARTVLPCSCIVDGEYGTSGCSIGVPAVIGREGVLAIEEWSLDPWEKEKFGLARDAVRGLCRELGV
ncbi:MAG: lactate dehydrogenase [Methanolinea sp.]|nr:lactate dehydrogenase [Methanolinea sp.]